MDMTHPASRFAETRHDVARTAGLVVVFWMAAAAAVTAAQTKLHPISPVGATVATIAAIVLAAWCYTRFCAQYAGVSHALGVTTNSVQITRARLEPSPTDLAARVVDGREDFRADLVGDPTPERLVRLPRSNTIEVRDALRRALVLLTDRQRMVLRLRYVDELTQSQIGERSGVSQMQVSRILRTILDVLRARLLAEEADRVRESAA